MPKKRKKKKPLKPKKYVIKVSRKQYELLRMHCGYTGRSPGKVLNQAVSLYLKTVSNELNYWKKINPNQNSICQEERAKQMEIGF